MGRAKRIWYLSPMRAAKVQASLRIRAVSPEPSLLAHTSSESRGTFRQKARSLAPLNGWACAVKICHDGMLEDTNSLDAAQMLTGFTSFLTTVFYNEVAIPPAAVRVKIIYPAAGWITSYWPGKENKYDYDVSCFRVRFNLTSFTTKSKVHQNSKYTMPSKYQTDQYPTHQYNST